MGRRPSAKKLMPLGKVAVAGVPEPARSEYLLYPPVFTVGSKLIKLFGGLDRSAVEVICKR